MTSRLALVFELMNLYEAIRGRRLNPPEVKGAKWMYQLLIEVNEKH
jgi:hypothetical protein